MMVLRYNRSNSFCLITITYFFSSSVPFVSFISKINLSIERYPTVNPDINPANKVNTNQEITNSNSQTYPKFFRKSFISIFHSFIFFIFFIFFWWIQSFHCLKFDKIILSTWSITYFFILLHTAYSVDLEKKHKKQKVSRNCIFSFLYNKSITNLLN